MKNRSILRIGVFISVIILWQLSCTTGKPKDDSRKNLPSPSGTTSAGETEIDKSDKPFLLADRHKNGGLTCEDCHQEKPPKDNVPTKVCLECHEAFSEAAKAVNHDEIDPHYSHMMISDCGYCHHVHTPSEDQCMVCHDFGFEIP